MSVVSFPPKASFSPSPNSIYSPPIVWDDVVNDASSLAAHLTDMDDMVSQLWDAVMGIRMTEEFREELRLGRPGEGAPPLARRAAGRPPRPFLATLSGYGGGWLAAHGIPDTQVELERVLAAECDRRGWTYGERQMRELASGLITGYKAAIREG